MNRKWSNENEQLLRNLQDMKDDFMKERLEPVLRFCEKMEFALIQFTPNEVAKILTDNADEVRDLLEPFDSGVREA